MGLGKKLKTQKEKREIKKTFEKYISKEAMDDLLSGKDIDIQQTKKLDAHFIFIKCDDSDMEKLPAEISKITGYLLTQKNVLIDTFFSSIISVIITKEDEHDTTDLMARRKEFAAELLTFSGNSISMIHGTRRCIVGNIGSASCMQYSYVLPDILDVLNNFNEITYGEALEI